MLHQLSPGSIYELTSPGKSPRLFENLNTILQISGENKFVSMIYGEIPRTPIPVPVRRSCFPSFSNEHN